jgi:dipeptidyl aminopeptidase/acylaminoacyl peptidase
VKSFDVGYEAQAAAVDRVVPTLWSAPDGLDMQGWLLLPKGAGARALVTAIHGGPVSNWRPTWLGRGRVLPLLLLLLNGYGVFLPNPRGSSGRGQAFARRVLGDMGGADTYDYLSGIDYLVGQNIADPKRLGVTGISYGGFMTSWLITQDTRFAAAVAVSPVTNHLTEHLISNIPDFVSMFLADSYRNMSGRYYSRSPVMYAQRAATPTLLVCGRLDRCTPPAEAVQFHNALLETGVESTLVIYPHEGHGVRTFPAAIDHSARLVAWFERHMSASCGAR